MIYHNIKVEIPSKKRIQKSTNYVYEILKRKGKDTPKDIVLCVGRAIDDQYMHPNDKYYIQHPNLMRPEPMEEPGDFSIFIKIGGYLLINEICKQEGLSDVLSTVFGQQSSLIISYITYLLLEQDSRAQHYKYFAFENYMGLNYIPSESTLSNLFNYKIRDTDIALFLQEWLQYRLKRLGDNTRIDIDFDSTNFNNSSNNLKLSEYGNPKVDEHLPQINLAYFIERNTGCPIFYDLYYGSIIDLEHCKTAIKKVKQLAPTANIQFVLDRGYFCQKNIEYIEENGYSYLCMAKRNTVLDDLMKEYTRDKMCIAENRIDDCIYGIKLHHKIFKDSKHKNYLYLFCNEGEVLVPYNMKQTMIENVCKQIIGKKDKKGYIRNTYSKYINIGLEKDIIISATPNYEYLNNYKKELGYFLIVSNEDLKIEDVYSSYRHRDVVEKAFIMSKTESDLLKKYSQTDNAYSAKTFLGFLTTVIRTSILDKCKSYLFEYRSETTQTILAEINKIIIQKINTEYVLKYSLTKRQKQILAQYFISYKNVDDLVKEINTIFKW